MMRKIEVTFNSDNINYPVNIYVDDICVSKLSASVVFHIDFHGENTDNIIINRHVTNGRLSPFEITEVIRQICEYNTDKKVDKIIDEKLIEMEKLMDEIENLPIAHHVKIDDRKETLSQ